MGAHQESTKRRKGHGRVGIQTGSMLDPDNWASGDREVQPRWARWYWAGPQHGIYFHHGNPANNQAPRPLVGWTPDVEAEAREMIQAQAAALDG